MICARLIIYSHSFRELKTFIVMLSDLVYEHNLGGTQV